MSVASKLCMLFFIAHKDHRDFLRHFNALLMIYGQILSHINQVLFRPITERWNEMHNSNKTISTSCGSISIGVRCAKQFWLYLRCVNDSLFLFQPTGTSSFLFTIISFCFFKMKKKMLRFFFFLLSNGTIYEANCLWQRKRSLIRLFTAPVSWFR